MEMKNEKILFVVLFFKANQLFMAWVHVEPFFLLSNYP